MREAMRSATTKTERETVEAGLRTLLRLMKQEGIGKLRGKVHCEGHLEEMRCG